MRQFDHLQVYDLLLITKAPLFIGSGTSYCKHEYIYDSGKCRVDILNQDAFFTFLNEKNLVDAYEHFILRRDTNLYRFLKTECNCSKEEIYNLVQYSVSAADALKEGQALKEIKAFQRDVYKRAYIPGSSVKGALRTAYLLHCILADKEHHGRLSEAEYLHTLSCKLRKKEDAVNSIFRGVEVSDSIPIGDDSMILAGKYDSGTKGLVNQINVCRECVRPERTIHMKLTLDQSVLKEKITKEVLVQSIKGFSEHYHKAYCSHFIPPWSAADKTGENCLIIGGGSGFFSKTLIYPYYGNRMGLEKTIRFFEDNKYFKQHRHEQDRQLGISPRMMKYTKFSHQLYPFGLCEVRME